MSEHPFLFTQKNWLGEGKIKLSMVDEELSFYTRWVLTGRNQEGQISAFQEIQIKGIPDMMNNQFLLSNLSQNHFQLELENAALGLITGKGIIKENLIAWEFRNPEIGFEGFEFYEKQPDESYIMRAEYATTDQHRTIIRGKIWPKSEPIKPK